MYKMNVLLIIVALLIIFCNRQPKSLILLKERYEEILHHVKTDPDLPPQFAPLKKRVLLTGFNRPWWGKELGYNINKGGEIAICLDNDVNSMMYVLIHELAHSTTKEYAHNDEFHENMDILRKFCIKWGLYKPMKDTEYCGIKINDM